MRKNMRFLKMLSVILILSCLSLSALAQENHLPIITEDEQLEQIDSTSLGSILVHLNDTDNLNSRATPAWIKGLHAPPCPGPGYFNTTVC